MNNKNIVLFFIDLALSTAIGLAHSLSYQDALAEQQAYCENVEGGIWPDYKENFKEVCKQGIHQGILSGQREAIENCNCTSQADVVEWAQQRQKSRKAKDEKTMKKQTITIGKVTILTWKRERNTTFGNPVFSFSVTDESGKLYSGKTRPNAGFVYGLCSYPEALEDVIIAITPSGRVYMDDAQ